MPEASPHAQIAIDLLDGRSVVSSPVVSPDGRHVAAVVSTVDYTKNKTFSTVWLDGQPLTGGEFDSSPFWSPDSGSLGFTSRRGEKKGESTLHVVPVSRGGETRTLCSMPDGVGSPSWSPDGQWIGFTSRTRDARYEAEDVSFQSPRKIERFVSRLNGQDWVFDRPSHVFVIPAMGTGTPKNLTPGEFQHNGISWLADSSGIATTAKRHENWDRDWAEDIYIVSLTGEIVRVTAGDGRYHSPSVSPDGTRVAFIGATDSRTYPVNDAVLVASTSATEQSADQLTRASFGLDRSFTCTIGTGPPRWESDENSGDS